MADKKEYIDIKIRCYQFSIKVIKYLDSLDIKKIYNSVLDQLLRSSTSIGANIIEAKSAHSKRDFVKYYEIALKSANETKYWLCLIRDSFNIDKKSTATLINEADEISKIIASSILSLKGKKQF